MDNNYFTQVSPYMQPVNQQEQAGLMPVFQNIAAQQANQNAALQQQNQQVAQAGQNQGNGMSGLNPLMMAMMLRGKKPDYDQWQTSGDMTHFGANSNGMGAGGSADFNQLIGLS